MSYPEAATALGIAVPTARQWLRQRLAHGRNPQPRLALIYSLCAPPQPERCS